MTDINIKIHSEHALPFDQHGDLIDLRYCGLDKKFEGEVKALFNGELRYKKGSIFRVNLGIAMKLPEGKKANVYPRSSTRKNYGVVLTNCVGQIDNNYSGTNDQWMAEFYALQDGMMKLGDRILQFEIVGVMPKYNFVQVDKLEEKDRGGYGSSGK